MKVKNLLPAEKIASYVDRILVIENNHITTPFILPLYANGVPTILFKSVKGKIGKEKADHLTLFGQTILPEALTLTEGFTLIAYFFKPYSLVALFGVRANELTDQPVDLNLLFPHHTREMREKLLNAENIAEMIAILDKFIFGLIEKSREECSLIKYATINIADCPTKKSLVAVQKELFITERTFQRLFEKNVGVAPNLYRRICQFNAAFSQLNSRKNFKLSDIAYRNGYADQSHYIRAFKEFTHITPKEYLKFGSGG